MGVDIHSYVVDENGEILIKDLFDGRNSEWFNNIEKCPYGTIYYKLPRIDGIPEKSPAFIEKIYKNEDEEGFGYFGFNYILVDEYIKWYEKYKPYSDAGWITRYDKWLYNSKGIYPDEDRIYRDIPEGYHPEEMCFTELENKYCPDSQVVENLEKNGFTIESKDKYLIYYFDC